MIKLIAAPLLALALPFASPASAQTTGTTATWVELAPPEGGFTIRMPAKAERQTGDIPADQGGPGRTVFYTTTANRQMFLAGWADYAPTFKFDHQAELAANRDNFVKGLGATLVDSRAISLNGAPGVEFDLVKPGEISGRARVYILGDKPFQFAFLNGGDKLDTATATRFFDSVRVVPAR